jgi:hypothetical protein
MTAMFVNRSGQNEQSYRRPSIDASYQVSVHLAKWFQRRFLEIDQSETRIKKDNSCLNIDICIQNAVISI